MAQTRAGDRLTRRRRVGGALRRFWQLGWDANITGHSAMLAYNMLIGVIPVALLSLFVGGQILSSEAVERSVLADLRQIFPGSTETTLNRLLEQIHHSTTGTGLLALVASLWLATSFWGALDTSFSRIYGCPSRPWLEQKRFGITMVFVLLLFMVATVAVPTVQSLLQAGAESLPLDLAQIAGVVYAISLLISLVLLFICLSVIYARVPNRWVPWRAVWPGALSASAAIAAVSYAFPAYLSHISTIARFGTTIVFVLIVLGWFYVIAVIILGGGMVNALRLARVSVPKPDGD
jgi:YihY family inner membrane protein